MSRQRLATNGDLLLSLFANDSDSKQRPRVILEMDFHWEKSGKARHSRHPAIQLNWAFPNQNRGLTRKRRTGYFQGEMNGIIRQVTAVVVLVVVSEAGAACRD